MTRQHPAWALLLEAARALTDRGVTPFTRDQLLGEVRRVAPERRESSLGPVLQGMTRNATGGVPSAAGTPLHRVGRGLYVLAESAGTLTSTPASPAEPVTAPPADPEPAVHRTDTLDTELDVVLIGCVKTKGDAPAPARDLFTSPLFRRRRAFAEASGRPWFILSAKHALVEPDDVLAPYDVYLPDQSPEYRNAWGSWVVQRLAAIAGPLRGKVIEVHAGSAYVEPLREPLRAHGAELRAPLSGLSMGEQLNWYDPTDRQASRASEAHMVHEEDEEDDLDRLVRALRRVDQALTPMELTTRRRQEWITPGLYSWWVDDPGAADLKAGLGHLVSSGLVYVGQAGATRWPSGRRSTNTLWGRLVGMHLGSRADFSTFRTTLGAALRAPLALAGPDDPRLSEWMGQHLRVVVVPVPDGDALGRIEHQVLQQLDPPLNLQGTSSTPVREALRRLRAERS